MKKVFILVFAIVMTAIAVSPSALAANTASKGTYQDVYDTDWFVDDVGYVHNLGLMDGVGEKFLPFNYATRGEIIQSLYRLDGKPSIAATTYYYFSDIPTPNSPYYYAINWAVDKGIIYGYGDEKRTVGVNDPVTREQLVTILYRYAFYKKADLTPWQTLSQYKDLDKVSVWATSPFAWAVATGLVRGTSGTELSPQGTTTRAELAAVSHRLGLMFNVRPRNDNFVATIGKRERSGYRLIRSDSTEKITVYNYENSGYTGKIEYTNTAGNQTQVHYDASGKIIRAVRYDTYAKTPKLVEDEWFEYDSRGELSSKRDLLTNQFKYYYPTYDSNGRVKVATRIEVTPTLQVKLVNLNFTYTSDGYTTESKDDVFAVSKTYDKDNRLVATRTENLKNKEIEELFYSYDRWGRLIETRYLCGNHTDYTEYYTYNQYDDKTTKTIIGKKNFLSYDMSVTYENKYDAYGNLLSQTGYVDGQVYESITNQWVK